jgi:DNA-binding CsgD family transcriptional regulator
MRLVMCTPCRLFSDVLAAALRPFGHAVTAASPSPDVAARAAIGTGAAACLLDTRPSHLGRATAMTREVRAVTAIAPRCAVLLLVDRPPSTPVPGAAGTLDTGASVVRVARALDRIAAGRPLPSSTARWLPTTRHHLTPRHLTPRLLTPREDTVLRCLGDGQTPDQIARRLGIARSTVRSNIGHMLAKLGASGTREAVALANRT